jgi:hypothetical protein
MSGAGLLACGPSQPAQAGGRPPQGASACADFELDAQHVWNAEAKASVRSGLLGAGFDANAEVIDKIETRLDGASRDWVMLSQKLCTDALVRGLVSKELYANLSACFDSALLRQRQVVTLLAGAQGKDEKPYLEAVRSVSDKIDACRDQAFQRLDQAHAEAERMRLRTCTDKAVASISRLRDPHTADEVDRRLSSIEDTRASYTECMVGAPLKPWEQHAYTVYMTSFQYSLALWGAIKARFHKSRDEECPLLKDAGNRLATLESGLADNAGYVRTLHDSKSDQDRSDGEWLDGATKDAVSALDAVKKDYATVVAQAPYCR